MPRRIKTRVHDVFAVPLLDDGPWVIGHVLDTPRNLFIGVHEMVVSDPRLEWSAALDSAWFLLAPTMDALLHHGRWPVVVRGELPRRPVPFPCYVVGAGSDQKLHVVDYRRTRQRLATEANLASGLLRHPFHVAPIRVQKAARAHFGFGEWDTDYNRLTYKHVASVADVV